MKINDMKNKKHNQTTNVKVAMLVMVTYPHMWEIPQVYVFVKHGTLKYRKQGKPGDKLWCLKEGEIQTNASSVPCTKCFLTMETDANDLMPLHIIITPTRWQIGLMLPAKS